MQSNKGLSAVPCDLRRKWQLPQEKRAIPQAPSKDVKAMAELVSL